MNLNKLKQIADDAFGFFAIGMIAGEAYIDGKGGAWRA